MCGERKGNSPFKKKPPTNQKCPSERKKRCFNLGDPTEAAVARRIRAGLQAQRNQLWAPKDLGKGKPAYPCTGLDTGDDGQQGGAPTSNWGHLGIGGSGWGAQTATRPLTEETRSSAVPTAQPRPNLKKKKEKKEAMRSFALLNSLSSSSPLPWV